MPEGVEQLHLLFAVAAGRMVGRQVLDQLPDAGAQLVGEMGRRRSDEGVDVADRRLCHAARSVTPAGLSSVGAVRRPLTVEWMLLTVVVLWSLNLVVTRYILTHGSTRSPTRPCATARRR
jgi:hypothetical protein